MPTEINIRHASGWTDPRTNWLIILINQSTKEITSILRITPLVYDNEAHEGTKTVILFNFQGIRKRINEALETYEG
jgi:hypothetical protein